MSIKKMRTVGLAWVLGASWALAGWIPFDLSSAFNYDAVGTTREDLANPGGIAPGIGDHNVRRQASYQDRTTYVNQGSATGGTGIPDDGIVGRYQLSTAFDNGTDGLTKSKNSICLQGYGTKTVVVNLTPVDQRKYTEMNLLFTSIRAGRGPYRSYIRAGYEDASSAIVVDTGSFYDTDPATLVGGTFGGAEVASQGGFLRSTDTYTFVNQAPGTGGTIAHSPALIMNRRMINDSTAIGAGTAVMWEFATNIALDPTKVLTTLTIVATYPSDNINREGGLWVYAISGKEWLFPGTIVTLR